MKQSLSARVSLRRNFIWILIGNLFFSGCQWSLLSLFAKTTNPETVGKFALAQAIVLPLMMIGNFNVGVMLVTDTNRTYRFAHYRFARVSLLAITFILIAAITQLSRFDIEMTIVTLLVGLTQAADCYSELYYSLLQRAEMMSRIALSLIFRGVVSLAAAVIVLIETRSLVYAVAALAAGRLTILIIYDLNMRHSTDESTLTGLAPRLSVECSRLLAPALAIVRTALPLAVVSFLSSLMINMPRYFIERYCGHRDLGVFAAMWSLLTAGNMVAIAVGQALFPRLAKLYAMGDLAAYKRLVWRSAQIAITLGLIGTTTAALIGRQVLLLVYRPEYAARHQLFTLLMAGGALIYVVTLLGYSATSAKSFKSQAVLMTVVVAATAISCFLFIPKFGLLGAVLSVSIGGLTQIAGLLIIISNLLGKLRVQSAPILMHPEVVNG